MKVSNRVLLSVALAAFSLLLYGCPLLFIGGLGYTGYQYHEKEGVFAPGQPLGGPAPDAKNSTSSSGASAAAPTPSASNIE